jgi:hypothetical protein
MMPTSVAFNSSRAPIVCPSILICFDVEGRVAKPLSPLSTIRTPTGLAPFKGFRSGICFQAGPFVKNVFDLEYVFKRVHL